jgi:hypothetical protein
MNSYRLPLLKPRRYVCMYAMCSHQIAKVDCRDEGEAMVPVWCLYGMLSLKLYLLCFVHPFIPAVNIRVVVFCDTSSCW